MQRKVAIVTGVSRVKGIGRSLCLELARKGFDIFFTYWRPYDQQMPWGVNEDEPQQIYQEIIEQGVRCSHIELNLTIPDSIISLLDRAEEKLGSPSVLINNATYSTSTSIDSLTAQELDNHYNINVKATTLLTQAFIQRFQNNGAGRIINITSGQSLGKMPNELAYAMTKSAMEMMTTTLSSELASRGITINAVNPGPNETGWMDKDLKNELIKRFPTGRVGTPTDTASLIGFLVSEEAAWITGQIIHSEGGFKR